MNETTERFLQEIATRVGYDRVAELYLFPVLRQGGVEGAVAVVAANPEPPEGADAADAASGAHEGAADAHAPVSDGSEPSIAEAPSAEGSEPEVSAGDEAPADVDGTPAEPVAADEQPSESSPEALAEAAGEVPVEGVGEATEGAAAEAEGITSGSSESAAEPVTAPEPPHATRARARHVVYTARYRHTIKGPDRGRWAVEVVAEADAPLVTVEEVVRGVVRRSGDEFQPERLSGEQFRALVRAPAAPGSAPA